MAGSKGDKIQLFFAPIFLKNIISKTVSILIKSRIKKMFFTFLKQSV